MFAGDNFTGKGLLALYLIQNENICAWGELRMANASFLNHRNGMDSESFRASRWTSGNHLFPTVIMVTDQAVVRHKRSWFSKDEISFNLSKVASVHIKTGLIWSDILIESSGGTDPLASHGHTKGDAQRIRALVEEAQGNLNGPEKLKLS
jgi:hypothetical protein